ncbi:hypothetical protein JCM17823_07320 [Halorubrum gandharaense]
MAGSERRCEAVAGGEGGLGGDVREVDDCRRGVEVRHHARPFAGDHKSGRIGGTGREREQDDADGEGSDDGSGGDADDKTS